MKALSTILLLCIGLVLQGQNWSGALSLGYSNASTSVDLTTSTIPDFEHGIAFRAEALYHLTSTNSKLGIGVAISANPQIQDEIGSVVRTFGNTLYGVKAVYHFSRNKLSPFIGLTAGLNTTAWTEYNEDLDVLLNSANQVSFGFNPQVGISFGNFELAVDYIPNIVKADDVLLLISPAFEASFLSVTLGYRIRE